MSLDPISPYMAQSVVRSLRFAGRVDEGIRQLQIALDLDPNYSMTRENLGAAYVHKGMYRDGIEELKYLGLGDRTKTFEWLGKGVEARAVNLLLKSDPIYQPLRGDPRFAFLLQRMNLKPLIAPSTWLCQQFFCAVPGRHERLRETDVSSD